MIDLGPDILRTVVLGEALALLVFIIIIIKRATEYRPQDRFEYISTVCSNTFILISYLLSVIYITVATITAFGEQFSIRGPLAAIILAFGIAGLYRRIKED